MLSIQIWTVVFFFCQIIIIDVGSLIIRSAKFYLATLGATIQAIMVKCFAKEIH